MSSKSGWLSITDASKRIGAKDDWTFTIFQRHQHYLKPREIGGQLFINSECIKILLKISTLYWNGKNAEEVDLILKANVIGKIQTIVSICLWIVVLVGISLSVKYFGWHRHPQSSQEELPIIGVVVISILAGIFSYMALTNRNK